MNKNNFAADQIEAMEMLKTERDKLRELHYKIESVRQQENLIESFGKIIHYLEHQSEIYRQSMKKRMNDSVNIIPSNESTDQLPDVDFCIIDKWRILLDIILMLNAGDIIKFNYKTIKRKLNETSGKI